MRKLRSQEVPPPYKQGLGFWKDQVNRGQHKRYQTTFCHGWEEPQVKPAHYCLKDRLWVWEVLGISDIVREIVPNLHHYELALGDLQHHGRQDMGVKVEDRLAVPDPAIICLIKRDVALDQAPHPYLDEHLHSPFPINRQHLRYS